MNIAWVGAGKLGMPCALALARDGHSVKIVDPSPVVADAVARSMWPYDEPGITDLLRSELDFALCSLEEAVVDAEAVFVAVQTPHASEYDGAVPMPWTLKGFDVSLLAAAVQETVDTGCRAPIVIVSTVLPGTCRDILEPILAGHPYVYSPAFVAMGSVLADLRAPEFILAGVRSAPDALLMREVYGHGGPPLLAVSVESAELAKMAYNTLISTKIVVANAIMEMAHVTGADCFEVTEVLSQATDRVVSARYLTGGMGDGGPCHPRDAIAMAYLADVKMLSANPFEFLVRAREAQTRWLAAVVKDAWKLSGLPVIILGRAYKAGVALEEGSPALLLGHYLNEAGLEASWIDERCGFPVPDPLMAGTYVLATPHEELLNLRLPPGSVIVDPWGIWPNQEGVQVVRVGRR